jgi:DMSO/TMAO reductase YedYZ heme-binding membrane subunit
MLPIIAISLLFSKQIHQYKWYLYALAVLVVIFTTKESPNIVNLGYVPIAFFVVVLFSGLLDKGPIRKKLFTVRAELAILGSILLFPHAFGYFEYFLGAGTILSASLSFYLGLVAFLLCIPLFITSFQKVRRKMNYKTWKKLHRLAYVFFFIVGVHLILLQNERMFTYILTFGFYFGFKAIILVTESSAKRKKQTVKTKQPLSA